MKTARQKILSTMLVAALATTVGAPRQAQATGLPVVDISAIMTAIMSQLNDIAQYAKEVQGMATDVAHYQAVMEHYRQQLIRLQRMTSALSFSGTQPLQKVADDYMVDTTCQGSHGGLNLRALLSGFRLDPKGDLIQQQRTICQLRQVARNQKFNETIDFLTRVKEETQTELSQLAARQDSGGETQAAVQTGTNDAAAASVRLSAIYQNYSSKVQMYDTQIASLDDMQRTLAAAALKGETNPIGTLVKTATLETALKVH